VDLVEWTPSENPPVAALAEGLDTNLDVITYGDADWALSYVLPYYGGDCTRSGQIDDEEFTEMQITVGGEGTLTFWWWVYSESNDALSFYIDDVERCDPISGDEHIEWEEKSFNITGEGNHKLTWRYAKNGWAAAGDDCGYVDCLQWTGGGPIPPPEPPEPPEPEWQTVSYVYDSSGRRIQKKVDGVVEVKYVYDGDHVIAEYDASDNLLRKYVYGPCIDEPICLIEATEGYQDTYYYHYDALGSVVALTNGAGTAVQFYDYSVYGQVSASDPNHPNRFMFTGREFDKDTGLYYYRARYYNPEIGRFLQTDPIGYGDGMNMYAYCSNGPVGRIDPSGCRDFDPSPYDYTYEFTCPALALGPSITSDEEALAAAQLFFDDSWTQWDTGWVATGAHLEDDGSVHIRFTWWEYTKDYSVLAPLLFPVPASPDLSVTYMTSQQDRGLNEAVILLNGVGLLEYWKFQRIVDPSETRVDLWSVRPGGPHLIPVGDERDLLIDSCDTAFRFTNVQQWEFGKVLYDKSQVNYYLEGYAMRHLNYQYTAA
jgi:RHS repeat-associated protein